MVVWTTVEARKQGILQAGAGADPTVPNPLLSPPTLSRPVNASTMEPENHRAATLRGEAATPRKPGETCEYRGQRPIKNLADLRKNYVVV